MIRDYVMSLMPGKAEPEPTPAERRVALLTTLSDAREALRNARVYGGGSVHEAERRRDAAWDALRTHDEANR